MEVVYENSFEEVKKQMHDAKLLYEHDKMVTVLYKAHRDIRDINNADSRYFGNSYKQATDLNKHSGPVYLPQFTFLGLSLTIDQNLLMFYLIIS